MDFGFFHNFVNDFQFVTNSFKGGSYAAVFLMSLFVAYIIPIPEVVVLLLAGYAAATGTVELSIVLLTAYAGIFIGDFFAYSLASFGNPIVKRFNKKISKSKFLQYEKIALEKVTVTVYFLRFFAGFRFFGPVFSGTFGINWKKFIVAHAGATFIHTALFVLLGYYFSEKILLLILQSEVIKYLLMGIAPFLAALLFYEYKKAHSHAHNN